MTLQCKLQKIADVQREKIDVNLYSMVRIPVQNL